LTTSIKTSCGTEILVSSEDLEIISKYNWHINKRGYVRTQAPRINGVQKKIMLHRLIAQAKPQQIVDHINRIKTDNRRENLRIVKPLINCLNRISKVNGASKFKGVAKQKNKWQVYVNGKYVGIFDSEKQAAMAYDANVTKVFGEFATTNKGMGLL
jgi:ribosomal protein S30